MTYQRVLASSLVLPGLACAMANPAFDDDELGDDAGTNASESDASESGTASGASTDEATSDASTSEATSDPTTEATTDTGEATSDPVTTDATSEGTSTSEGETGIECMPGQTDCGGSCVDTQTDPFNCGGCEVVCNEAELCLGECVIKKYVFVGSEPKTGNMGGIQGADALCDGLAGEAGLPGSYFAWNSTLASYPNFDFDQTGVYVRTDGQLIAESYADLTDSQLLIPITLDENQDPVPLGLLPNCLAAMGAVWSNTTAAGDYAGEPNCANWTTNSVQAFGKIGSMSATDGGWSQLPNCFVPCNTPLPIYCVQQTP
ncbi:hypothetical protein ACNOYE_30505 [Nannocystaceae bacterium ST9]